MHNSEGGGDGHAEVRVWQSWWGDSDRVKGARPLMMAMVGFGDDEQNPDPETGVYMRDKDGKQMYIPALMPCGRCREFICEHIDYDIKGNGMTRGFDIDFFTLARDGRVFQSTLRTLYPGAFEPTNVKVPIDERGRRGGSHAFSRGHVEL